MAGVPGGGRGAGQGDAVLSAGFPAERLLEIRTRRGISRARLARRAGISETTVFRLERRGTAHTATLRLLADALGVTPIALREGEKAEALLTDAEKAMYWQRIAEGLEDEVESLRARNRRLLEMRR